MIYEGSDTEAYMCHLVLMGKIDTKSYYCPCAVAVR